MQKITKVELIIEDPRPVGKNNIINKVDSSSKVGNIKFQVDSQVKLAKSKLLVESNSELGFLIPNARIAKVKLK